VHSSGEAVGPAIFSIALLATSRAQRLPDWELEEMIKRLHGMPQ
jgi:hypothetical protein